jgi:hypothetical protein
MGFNADETKRVERDVSYSTEERNSEYPLLKWAWGRVDVERYLTEWAGSPWPKSCCTFCPFANNKKAIARHLKRLSQYPDLAAEAAIMERVATAFNPKQTLYAKASFEDLLEADEHNTESLAARDTKLENMPWAIYRVRRAWAAKCHAARQITTVARGARQAITIKLVSEAAKYGLQAEVVGRHVRVRVIERGDCYPCPEELLVTAPALAHDKERKSFQKRWANVIEGAERKTA